MRIARSFGGVAIGGVIFFLAFLVVGIVLLPFIFIWSVNTLFDLGIPYNFWTWLAAVVLWLFLLSTRGVRPMGGKDKSA